MAHITVAQLAAAVDLTRRQLRQERPHRRMSQRARARGWRTPDQIAATIDRARRLVYLVTLTRRRIDRRWRIQ
jgi:hypothetical protein